MSIDDLKMRGALAYLQARAWVEAKVERVRQMPRLEERLVDVLALVSGGFETARGLRDVVAPPENVAILRYVPYAFDTLRDMPASSIFTLESGPVARSGVIRKIAISADLAPHVRINHEELLGIRVLQGARIHARGQVLSSALRPVRVLFLVWVEEDV